MSTSQQSGWKKQIAKWTSPKRLAAIIVFLVIVFLLEYVIIYSSIALGLTDSNPLVWQTAYFTLSISLLFHLLPLSVILVLFLSWIYLTRHVAITYHKAEPTTTRPPPPRRYEKVRFKTLRRYYKRISKKLGDTGRKIKETLLDSRLAKYLGRAVIKSAWTVVLTFCALALLVYLIAFPELIPDAATGALQGANSAFLGFVVWSINAANFIGQTLSPIGWVAANINNGLAASSIGFRNAIIGITTPIVKPLIDLDLVGKYVLVQNIAAWVSALTALYYAQYSSKPTIRRRSK